MREAIGGTWLFNLVIFFVLLFAGYMCLSINYSKAFSVKDKIITEIERNGGIRNFNESDETIKEIVEYMANTGYRTEGKCVTGGRNGYKYDYGCDRDGKCYPANDNTDYAFCLSEVRAENTFHEAQPGEFIFVSYYKVKVFYQLDLPVIRQMFNFSINGDTRTLFDIEKANKD